MDLAPADDQERSDPRKTKGRVAALPSSRLVVCSTRSGSSEVYDGLADGEVPLDGPRQVEELGRDELEDLVHVDVVRRAREEEGRLHRSCVCPGLTNQYKKKKHIRRTSMIFVSHN